MKLTRLGGECGDGRTCPTIYATDRDTVVVQGYTVTDGEALTQINLPDGEQAVEIPTWLLKEVAARADGG